MTTQNCKLDVLIVWIKLTKYKTYDNWKIRIFRILDIWSKLKSKRDCLSELILWVIDVFLNSVCFCKLYFQQFWQHPLFLAFFISRNKCEAKASLWVTYLIKWHACSNSTQPKILIPTLMISHRFPRANMIQKPFEKKETLQKVPFISRGNQPRRPRGEW